MCLIRIERENERKGKETKATRLELVCLDKNRETHKEALFEGFALPRSWENPFEGAEEIKSPKMVSS
jgi:hypothetical protein